MIAAQESVDAGFEIAALTINYGQRHKKELLAANEIAKFLGITEHLTVDIDLYKWGGSSLTDFNQQVPIDGIQENIVPNTYVPGRNTVFIAIGLSLAEAKGAGQLVLR